jgi:hypothetical protein
MPLKTLKSFVKSQQTSMVVGKNCGYFFGGTGGRFIWQHRPRSAGLPCPAVFSWRPFTRCKAVANNATIGLHPTSTAEYKKRRINLHSSI